MPSYCYYHFTRTCLFYFMQYIHQYPQRVEVYKKKKKKIELHFEPVEELTMCFIGTVF